MSRKWFSPWGDSEPEKPVVKSQALPAKTLKAEPRLRMNLTDQVRTYLLTHELAEQSAHAFCRKNGYPTTSLNNILRGTGMHVHSLERLAQTLGWSVVVTDSEGRPVATL